MPLSALVVLSGQAASGGDAPALAAGPDLTRYIGVCIALLATVAGLAWGFRKLAGRVLVQRAARRSLQVLDLLPLGGKSRVAVVRCYDRSFLVGLGEREVTLLAELDPDLAPRAGAPTAAEIAPARAPRESFQKILASALGGSRAAPAVERAREPTTLGRGGVLG
jgi:flagellar biogenesis protein FliO